MQQQPSTKFQEDIKYFIRAPLAQRFKIFIE